MNARRTVAIHEAAHAVSAWALGIRVTSIEVNDNSGRVRTRCSEQTIDEIERSLIVTLAGSLAQRMIVGEPRNDSVFRGDRRDEIELTDMLAQQTSLFEADIRALACEQHAERIVRRNREAIEGLARQLMREMNR